MAIEHKWTIKSDILKEIQKGIPEDFLNKMAKGIIQRMRVRIVFRSQTADGEPLSPNSPFWADFKQENKGHNKPLVFDDRLTRARNWEIEIKQSQGKVDITLQDEKLENIFRIADETGKNWREAFKLGDNELAVVKIQIAKWLEEIGILNVIGVKIG